MIIVVGAGIAGLSVAWELVKQGHGVTVLESASVASGASGVATSYLEPRLGATSMRAIEWEALARWPTYAAELEEASCVDVGFRSEGQLRVTIADYADKFEKDIAARVAQGWDVQRLSTSEILEREPCLSPQLEAGAFLPSVRWVTGKRVCEALAVAIRGHGGRIEENWPVTGIIGAAHGVTVRGRENRVIAGSAAVLCNGMGSGNLEMVPADVPESRPVRGVNLVMDMGNSGAPIRHLIKHHRGNLCPRTDRHGRNLLIVGTTYELDITSLKPEASVIEQLYANAQTILPGLRDLLLLEVTAGLRTIVGDGLLRLGRSVEEPKVFYSLSHAGAGFLRAPVVANEFATFIARGQKGRLTGFLIPG